jgi:hypothetical protein
MVSAPRLHELSRSPLHIQREHDFWSSKCATLNSNSLSWAHAWRVWQASIAERMSQAIFRSYACAAGQ